MNSNLADLQTRRPYTYQERLYNAIHEAGHAVAMHDDGWPIDRLTLAARGRMGVGARTARAAAAVVGRTNRAIRAAHRTPMWEADVTIAAAGMAATAVSNVLTYGRSDAILRHRCLAGDGGFGSHPSGGDMPYLRWAARTVWHNATDPRQPDDPPVDLGPAFDPAWAGDPAGVEAIAVHGWRRAVNLTCNRWGAVDAVARAAVASSRALTGRDIAAVIATAPTMWINPDHVTLDDVNLPWWPGTYSRLKFRPAPVRTGGAR